MKINSLHFIFKPIVLIFGILSLITDAFYMEIRVILENPDLTFESIRIFGMLKRAPWTFEGVYAIIDGGILLWIFPIVYIIGFVLSFGYIETEKPTRMRKYLALISGIIMLIGYTGLAFSTFFSAQIIVNPPTTIKTFFPRLLLPLIGAIFCLLTIGFILLEWLLIKPRNIINSNSSNKE